MKFKTAKKNDIPSIVRMLADDELGSKREDYKNPLLKNTMKLFKILCKIKTKS